jgi:hypothetical protein
MLCQDQLLLPHQTLQATHLPQAQDAQQQRHTPACSPLRSTQQQQVLQE